MNIKGIEIVQKNIPALDSEFIGMAAFSTAFEKSAKGKCPLAICLERENGQISRFDTFVHAEPAMREADVLYVERTVKMMLWAAGGFKIFICGCAEIAAEIAKIYSKEGVRSFDNDFMERVYGEKFEVVSLPYDKAPKENANPKPIGGKTEGCRIGFDAGGSDRKVSAVIDGECVYSEEVLWLPKENTDPDYHFNEILTAFKTAASKMPKVDAIGVSSAGIYIDNHTAVASLFKKIPQDLFDAKVKDIYIRAAREIGENIPLNVVNDGDVSALAGAITIGDNEILGIAMGTSEAVGYVDKNGYVTGWLNELAFAPVDIGKDAAFDDDWSGDKGVGNKYFSQDAVIRLAPKAGIEVDNSLTLAKKLKAIQNIMDGNDAAQSAKVAPIFETIGCYFAHAVAYYAKFYEVKHILLLGRVMSGKGGDILLETANRVLAEEYPEIKEKLSIDLPDEKFRRLGQSVVAASL